MKILLDCGAFTGDSLPTLIKGFGPFDRIVCFEANPRLVVEQPPGQAVEVIRAAVWTANGEMKFFFGDCDTSSSLMANKTTGNFSEAKATMVPSVDLARWLADNTDAGDEVVLKMDIEGAEFDVLEHLAGRASRSRVKRFLIEWHNNRLRPRWGYGLRRRMLELRYALVGQPLLRWSQKRIDAIHAA